MEDSGGEFKFRWSFAESERFKGKLFELLLLQNSEILRDKTMYDKLFYINNDNT